MQPDPNSGLLFEYKAVWEWERLGENAGNASAPGGDLRMNVNGYPAVP